MVARQREKQLDRELRRPRESKIRRKGKKCRGRRFVCVRLFTTKVTTEERESERWRFIMFREGHY